MPPRAQATILIEAPVERVFRYLSDPEKQFEWAPTDVHLAGRGWSCRNSARS